jgi:LPXTG-site transpeptidase (sortase) family protein
MYANKDDKNLFIMVLVIFVVSIIAIIAIGGIIWRIISPGVNIAVNEVSSLIRVNRLDYNFDIPASKGNAQQSSENQNQPQQEQAPTNTNVSNNLNYNFSIPQGEDQIVKGNPNFFEEIYSDSEIGPNRITDESNKNIIVNIPKLSINSPIYQIPSNSIALKFGFWLHKSSYELNKGEVVILCTRRYFDNNDPRSCYFLDYLREGENLSLEYEGQKYNYRVIKTETLTGDYGQIYNNISTDKNLLKIVTTGTIDTGKGRLVITAQRI